MARPPRIHYYGAVYHVIARGNNKEDIFIEESDKEKYLQLIEFYKSKYNFLLYAYVLMNNHVHMLVEVKEQPLAKIMQGIQLTFTQYFNKKYHRVGHVFQQRYKSILCSKDKHLPVLIKYIHENPLRAGLSKTPDYYWSSHQSYLREESILVDTAFPLSLFHRQPETARKEYRYFMYHVPFDSLGEINIYETRGGLSGKGNFGPDKKTAKASLEEILALVAKETALSRDDLIKKSRKPEITRARRLFLYLAVFSDVFSRTDAAKYLGLSPSAITKALNDVENDPEYRSVLKKLGEYTKKISRSKS